MNHDDDALSRLRDADPVAAGSLPSAHDPDARALLERITMNEPTEAAPRRPRRRLLVATAAAVLLLVLGLTYAAQREDDDGTRRPAATGPSVSIGDGDGQDQEPITPGGSLASCVETYDLTTLENRSVAFDGSVTSVDGDEIGFRVNRWYRGGSGEEITLRGASTLGGVTTGGPPLSLDPGERLLVAGDGGFAWSCGFTQPFDVAVARQWEQALAGPR